MIINYERYMCISTNVHVFTPTCSWTSDIIVSRATKLSKVHKRQDQTGPNDQTRLDKSFDISGRIAFPRYCCEQLA